MTKKEACELRDEIKAAGIHCTIPRGRTLPRIFTDKGELEFSTRQEWLDYKEKSRKRRLMLDMLTRRRNPMQKAIDDACGITWEAYNALR